jgi:hypothetical protein
MAALCAFAATAFQSIALPRPAFACSCVADLPSLAETAERDNVAIVTGTVGVAQPDRTPFVVQTWFHGGFPAKAVWLAGGTNMMSSCDIGLGAGQQWFLVLYGGPAAPDSNGLYSAGMCSQNARLDSDAGQAYVTEATVAFGGQPPPTSDPEPASLAAPIDVEPWLVGLPVVAAISLVALAFLAIVALVARRRPG